ncbi:MAG: hypothetical protein ACLU8F_05950 [Clostridia bacterium]
MEFKKCARCGCFYMSEDDVCVKCYPKDKFEMSKFNQYLEQNYSINSIDRVSAETGISVKNINRYLSGQKLSDYIQKLESKGLDDININL